MTTKPKITITPKEGNIQFDIRQGNQTRWFSVEEETARELYQKLGIVLNEQDDWVEREMQAFLFKKRLEKDYPVERFIDSDHYKTERQHVPKILKEIDSFEPPYSVEDYEDASKKDFDLDEWNDYQQYYDLKEETK